MLRLNTLYERVKRKKAVIYETRSGSEIVFGVFGHNPDGVEEYELMNHLPRVARGAQHRCWAGGHYPVGVRKTDKKIIYSEPVR